MARHQPKRQAVGFALEINRTGGTGAACWERVGHLAYSKQELHDFRAKHYPHISKFRIFTVRVNCTKLADYRGTDTESRMNPATKGEPNAA